MNVDEGLRLGMKGSFSVSKFISTDARELLILGHEPLRTDRGLGRFGPPCPLQPLPLS